MSHVSASEYLKKILLAPVYEAAVNSDFDLMNRLSGELGNQIYLKREDQQPVKSFKLRGAYNRICQLSQAQLEKRRDCCISREPCSRDGLRGEEETNSCHDCHAGNHARYQS